MLVRFTKNKIATDTLTCVRPDGSTTTAEMARRGILPHEAFHFVVESTLGWHDAFFGHVARGEAIEAITAKLHHEAGAWTKHTQALQSEALIVCLEAEQWGGASDPATFAQKLIAACRRHGVLPPDITADELETVRGALRDFGAAWRPLPADKSLERTFGT
jgi:hypothetical protein